MTFKYKKILIYLIAFILVAILTIDFIANIKLDRGEHVGYITATETRGLVIRTGTTYFKTDSRSSTEYVYCVIGHSLFRQLSQYANKAQKVIITYHRQVYVFRWHCNGEKEIIDSVKPQD